MSQVTHALQLGNVAAAAAAANYHTHRAPHHGSHSSVLGKRQAAAGRCVAVWCVYVFLCVAACVAVWYVCVLQCSLLCRSMCCSLAYVCAPVCCSVAPGSVTRAVTLMS